MIDDAKLPPADDGRLDLRVGRLVIEATDAEGPRGTYGCACLDRDAVQCAAIRYGMDHWGEACLCLCHQWSNDDDDYH